MFDMHNLKPRFMSRSGGALLHLSLPRLPTKIVFEEEAWVAKREFHVTLVGRAMWSLIFHEIGAIGMDEIEEIIGQARKSVPFRVHMQDEIWMVREEEKRSLIQTCNVEGSEAFYRRLEKSLGASVPRPPLHVTLFTANSSKGIGLATRDALEECGRRLTPVQLLRLREAIDQ